MGSAVVRLRFSCAVRHTPATGVVNAPAIGMAKRAMCYAFVYAPWLLIWGSFSVGARVARLFVLCSRCALGPQGGPGCSDFCGVRPSITAPKVSLHHHILDV